MDLLQLLGLMLFALALGLLLAAPAAYAVRALARAMRRPVDHWDGFFARWPARFVILGIVGMALGWGLMWGPSLVIGAKADRAEQAKERQ